MRIELPKNLPIDECISFSNNLFNSPDEDIYEFDFARMNWYPPFSLLYLACQINRFKALHTNSNIIVINHERHYYAAHMAFFKAFGVDWGNSTLNNAGNDNHLPITDIETREIIEKTMSSHYEAGDIIERKSEDLAKILVRQDEGDLFKTLSYSIREMIRNCYEHSHTDRIQICAQYWPGQHRVEIGICDTGVGIRSGLEKNPKLKISSDKDALDLSVLPGISGTVYNEKGRSLSPWANSGYGLFMTSNICAQGGSFFLASGTCALKKKEDKTTYYEQNFQGTAIRLILDTSKITPISERLSDLAKQGRKIAREIDGSDPFGPSIVSRVVKDEPYF